MKRSASVLMNSIAATPLLDDEKLHLRLYTGPKTFESVAAIAQVHSLLGSLSGSYEIEVLKGDKYREQAQADEALFTPLLVRLRPGPVLRVSMPQGSSEELRRAVLSCA
jgi:hypothetical protein